MATAYLSIGSNLDPEAHIRRALDIIQSDPHIENATSSPVYENEAVGPPGQPNFYNLALQLKTDLPTRDLYQRCRDWEAQCGRQRNDDKFAARHIDIDLILYDDLAQETDGVRLPHPQVLTQAFVLYPLSHIAADLVIPSSDMTVKQALQQLQWKPSDFREVTL